MRRPALVVSVLPLALASCALPSPPVDEGPAQAAHQPGPPDQTPPEDTPPAFTPATVPAAPQVVDLGGQVLTAPKVAAVYFAGDTLDALVDPFVAALQPSGFWTAATSEYGVGALAVSPSLRLAGAAPSSLTPDDLAQRVGAALAAAGDTPDPSTTYLAIVPAGTSFDDGEGLCCQDFDGEHFAADVDGATVPLAVVCRCSGGFGPQSSDDELTSTVSHELVEAATDPFDDPAYAQADDDHVAWTLLSGGEVGDMCDLIQDPALTLPGMEHPVQRSWSNRAAAAGEDPCVPARPGEVYIESVPVLDDALTMDIPGFGRVATVGKKLAVGATGTIPVKLASAADTAAWHVDAFDVSSGNSPDLDLSLDQDTGNNGDTLTLTVTLHAVEPDLGAALFVLDSTADDGTESVALGLVRP